MSRDEGAAFRVREATVADLDAVGRLLGQFQGDGPWRRDPPIHAAARAAIVAGRAAGLRIFIAEEAAADGSSAHGGANGGAAAIAFASTWDTLDLGDGPGTWVSDVYVVPDRRRRGVARSLMAAAAAAARAAGSEWMMWHVDHENPDAQAFYVALGAEPKPAHLVMTLRLRD